MKRTDTCPSCGTALRYASEIDGDPEEWKSILTEWMEEQNA